MADERKRPRMTHEEFRRDAKRAFALADEHGGLDVVDDNGTVRMHIAGSRPRMSDGSKAEAADAVAFEAALVLAKDWLVNRGLSQTAPRRKVDPADYDRSDEQSLAALLVSVMESTQRPG
jgi:hypothetical protein